MPAKPGGVGRPRKRAGDDSGLDQPAVSTAQRGASRAKVARSAGSGAGTAEQPGTGGPRGDGFSSDDMSVLTDAVLQALHEIPRLLPVRSASFFLQNSAGILTMVGPVPLSGETVVVPDLQMQVTEVLASLRPIVLPAFEGPNALGETYLVPLLVQAGGSLRAVGAAVFVADAGKAFSKEDLLSGVLITSQVAEAVHRRRLDQELERHQKIQRGLLSEVISAQENERKRIAADIHNDILQILGYNLLKVEICQRYLDLGDSDRLQGEFEAMRSTLEESVQQLREIIFQLRPSTLDERGLLATIDAHLARFEAETGMKVRFGSRLGRRLEPHLETLVYRLVQEALANVRKHARATRASISLEGRRDLVRVVIEDNGRGFKVEEALSRSLGQGHIGLHSMRERAELAGGSLSIESREGRGTRLTFVLPRSP